MVKHILTLVLACLFASPSLAQESKVQVIHRRAHAHNDYLHKRPLLDALDNGFCSVEADVFLVDGELLVAHFLVMTRKDRTLKSLYLDPLRERVKSNSGSVHGDETPLTLLIDIKGDGADAYKVLAKQLAEYPDLFGKVVDGKRRLGPVRPIISGDRAFETIKSDENRLAGIDGRLSDLGREDSTDLMPLISDNWRKHFKWRGEGEFPKPEKEKLQRIVTQAHQEKRRIRFWASADTKAAWRELNQAGVDLINTDDLSGLNQFLTSTSNPAEK